MPPAWQAARVGKPSAEQDRKIIQTTTRRTHDSWKCRREDRKGEGLEDQDEAGEQDAKIVSKLAEDIDVEHHGKAATGGRAARERRSRAVERRDAIGSGPLEVATDSPLPSETGSADGASWHWVSGGAAGDSFRARRESDWACEPFQCGGRNKRRPRQRRCSLPRCRPRAELSLAGPVIPGNPEEVIAADQYQREDQTRRAAASAWTDSDRHAEQSENQARHGKREAIVEFDAGVTPIGPRSARRAETGAPRR